MGIDIDIDIAQVLTVIKLASAAITLVKNLNDDQIVFRYSDLMNSDVIKLASMAAADKNYINNSNYKKEKVEKYINDFIKNETILNKMIAQLRPVDHRGIMFLGPSGAGKTTLINAFISKIIKSSEKLSTTGIKRKYIPISNKVICLRDTFGRSVHGDRREMLINECIKEPPKILCLVFANSYLQTVHDSPLTRGQLANFKDEGVDKYLEFTRREEIDWIKDFIEKLKRKKPRSPIQDLVIVANKMDLWGESITKYQEVENYYTQNEYINELCKILVDESKKPYFLGVMSEYDSFMRGEVDPVSGFSKDASTFSILLLRAYIYWLLTKKR